MRLQARKRRLVLMKKGHTHRRPYKGDSSGRDGRSRQMMCSDNCTWWDLIEDERTYDEDCREGKAFRAKFRVPRSVFDAVVHRANQCAQFSDQCRKRGSHRHPLVLKVAAWFRVLAKGVDFEAVEEVANISAECLRVFFHAFSAWFVRSYWPEVVKLPEGHELQLVLRCYAKLGYPGAVGSTDGVHFPWDRAPAGSHWLYKGKESMPTVAANVTVAHNLKVLHSTELFGGATNDKTMAQWDRLIQAIKTRARYADVVYELYNKDGQPVQHKGAYLIVDNGYHKWRCLQAPAKVGATQEMAFWSITRSAHTAGSLEKWYL